MEGLVRTWQYLVSIWAHLCIPIIMKKDILILDKGTMKELNNTKLTAEAEFSINFNKQEKKFLLKSTLKWKKQLFIC